MLALRAMVDIGRGNDGSSRRIWVEIAQWKLWQEVTGSIGKKEGPANDELPDDITI